MAQAALSRLSGLASKARSTIEPTYKFAEKQVTEQYHKTMQANKQYVVQDQAAADKLFKQWFFTKMARHVHRLQQSQRPHESFSVHVCERRSMGTCPDDCRIPKTMDASKKEWSDLKGQWAKRSDLHLTEVLTGQLCALQSQQTCDVMKQRKPSQVDGMPHGMCHAWQLADCELHLLTASMDAGRSASTVCCGALCLVLCGRGCRAWRQPSRIQNLSLQAVVQ